MTRPEFEGDEAMRCGGCGSRNMLQHTTSCDGVLHGVCEDCQRFQEVETRDWPLKDMCDNCAFRKGSPEQADPYRWAEIMETLQTEQPFHCHKGLNANLNPVTGTITFDAPDPDEGRVTICAGWFSALMAKYKKDEREVS